MPPTFTNPQEHGLLPPELEREIFEFAALSRPVMIPKLMLVAWHVKEWVEPLLYRTIVFDDPIDGYPAFTIDVLLSAIRSKPAFFFHNAVRHISFQTGGYISPADGMVVISACSGVENIVAYRDPPLGDSQLPLKRLSTALRQMLDPFESAPLSQADFAHPLLSHLTHLELRSDFLRAADADEWTGLATLPQLTHLAFHSYITFPVFKRILDTSSTLELLVLLTPYVPSWETEGGRDKEDESLLRDMRFVVMTCGDPHRDWQMGARGGKDHWKRAEEFTASRRAGLVNQWFIETDESIP
ncbi:hypothetical protein C8F04DRAFT_1156516 [Mycena alexandri]|uniref:Uncharacterized protein n=1 Tax=Mycena alexandri TaxID=1745969 RepID=A0AAD6RZD4_9AGAR|nr:hypothetical protein C8F04DRAFT_1156516 [Mycena alexandri]